ncbi:hypothetical protein [Streptomyces sp. NPDC018031]|uniref:hypothetical protein n=1 Tax=Streptomyces sp. NPDC018031 TaxID=3365033 RepID=UPI0037950486
MSPSPGAVEYQERQAALAAATARAVRPLWEQVDAEDMRGSWAAAMPRVVALVTAGQLGAAREADPYLRQLLPDAGAEGRVVPGALAGVAGDGRDLPGLLAYPLWHALARIARGLSLAVTIASGAALLELLARTLVADAGRAATLVGMIARPAVTSYVRVVELPACARCIILAGREYGISEGFARHPRCDCTMEPVTAAHRPTPVDAMDVYRSMSAAQQREAFGAAAVRAIGDGADIAQVVNARRGMTTATRYGRRVQATTEGTTRRGIAGRRLGRLERADGQRYRASRTARLMPEEIYRLADGDRAHALRLLRRHGYVV